MPEQSVPISCPVCGNEYEPSEEALALCAQCTDAWERDSESHW